MRELHIDIKNKIATYNTRGGAIVCGNNDYKIRFTFDEEWDEYPSKQARFAWNGKYIDVVFLGDTVPVPMLSQATELTVGVYTGEELCTTTPAKIPCLLSVLCETDKAKEADYYEVNGILEHRLPVITPADQGKLLQANNGKYELRTRAELTYNEDISEMVKAVEDKVDAIAPYVTKITDLTGTTWPLKDILEITKEAEYHINFNHIAVGNQEYALFNTLIVSAPNRIYYQNDYDRISPQYPNGDWLASDYQTITIHGGGDATNPELIDLLGLIAKSAPAYQTVGDQRLLTSAKTIVGAINELQNTTTIVKGYYDKARNMWFSNRGMTEQLFYFDIDTGNKVAFEASLVNIAIDMNTGAIHMDKGNTTVEEIIEHSEWYQNVTKTINEIQKWWKENVEDPSAPFVDALWKEVQRILEQIFKDLYTIAAIPDRVTTTENDIDALEKSIKSLNSNLSDLQTRYLELIDMVNNHYLRLNDIDTKNNTMLAGINELQAGVFGKVIDLTGSTWVWKNTIEAPTGEGTNRYYLKFICDGTEYSYIRHEAAYTDGELILKLYYGAKLVYESNRGWEDNKYRTVSIISGSAVTNTDCIKLLYTNGELQFEADFLSPIQRKEDKNLRTSDKTIVGAINEVNAITDHIIEDYAQPREDTQLITKSKTVAGAINEVKLGLSGKITDLANTTWKLNDVIKSIEVEGSKYYDIDFISRDIEYHRLKFTIETIQTIQTLCLYYDTERVYDAYLGWYRSENQHINIKGGDKATSASLIDALYTCAELQEGGDLPIFQIKKDESLKTKSKEIVGAINEVNSNTVDKIRDIDIGYSHSTSFNDYGIVTEQDTTVYSFSDKTSSVDITLKNKLPIVAGENVTFELDAENQVVKINATGGGDASNLATVDKVKSIDTWYEGVSELNTDDCIYWRDGFAFYDGADLTGNEIASGIIHHRIPIVAGNGIQFENDGSVVKINATGGNSTPTIKYSEGLDYSLNPDGVSYSVSGIGSCTDTDLIIPPTYEGLPVTYINDYMLRECSFNSVYIPKSVTGMYAAFDMCEVNIFYCEAETQPDSWYPDWAGSTEVVWGYVLEQPNNSGGISDGLEMPQIRFTTANGNDRENSTFYVNENSPLKLTVEIVGGGALQVGDQLQVCKQKRFDGCRANNFRRKYKLQKFEEYIVTEEDLDKRFLTINIIPNRKAVEHGLYRDGKEASLSPLYLRIRRAKGDMQNNDSGQTVDAAFSNVVTVWKSYHRSNHWMRIY